MGKHLIIAEKPSVAKDIALSLGGFGRVENWLESPDAVITAAQGHLVEVFSSEMATSGKSLETLPVIPSKFELRVIELANKPQAFQQIKRLMARNDIDRIVNACDSGREGELIFRLIYDLAECKKPVMRMWFNSMTSEAIRDAYRGMLPGSRFDALADAAYCRTEGDYLVGINGSRGVTRLYERQTSKAEIRSVGRVQTPTGALVYDREVAIRTFKAKDYWEVHGEFGVAAGSYIGKWIAPERETPGDAPEGSSDGQAELDHQYRIFDKGRAEAILTRCTGVAPSDVKQESKPATKGSPKLYDLTLLQREANKKLGLTSKQTDTIAQALYEKHKVTTYPRTDSCFLPEDYIAKAKSVIEALVETPYRDHATRILSNGWIKPDKRIFDNSKISDHFAIIPTGKMPEGLSPDEEKVYDLVVKRFLSVFHPAAQYEVTTRLTIIAGEHFKSSGRVLVDPGWLAVYGTQTQDDDKKIPALTKYVPGESVSTEGMELKTLKTKPPVRYTEDTLLGAMEGAGKLVDDEELREAMKERGLGAPSTRSAIIEGLLATKDGRDRPMEPYLRRDGKTLVPSQKLMSLIAFLRENGLDRLTSPALTGEWEHKLRLMERGEYLRPAFNSEISEFTRHIIKAIREQAAQVVVKKLDGKCPNCGGEISVGARSFDCESGCGFRFWREVAGRPLKPQEVEALLAKGTVENLSGFVSSSKKRFTAGLTLTEDFKLKFVFDETAQSKDASGALVHCPTCEKLMRRFKGANGFFWSCTDRENCKTTLDDKAGNPVAKAAARPCPKCGHDMNRIPWQKRHFWACSDREQCKHTMDDKDGVPVEKAQSFPCPDCSKPMYRRQRRDQKGYFWGCSGYQKDGSGCSCMLEDRDGKPVPKDTAPNIQDDRTFL